MQFLTLLGRRAVLFGTLGYGTLGSLRRSANTTLGAVELQRRLREAVDAGAEYAVLEVSSIGVCAGRIDNCRFYAGGFSNLTRDHLDYHGSMENYLEAKKNFLLRVPPERLVINCETREGKALAADGAFSAAGTVNHGAMSAFPAENRDFVLLRRIEHLKDGLRLTLESRGHAADICRISLLGTFNADNFALAFALLLRCGFGFDELLQAADRLTPIRGRMECFSAAGKPRLLVDYAHTPDGVQQALKAARDHLQGRGRLWIVLGCGGDRDHGKRPIMAMKASVYADECVFTSDNPRSEDPLAILEDMKCGVSAAGAANISYEPDREKAIRLAFSRAQPEDCIVIAGKGHEDYQIFKDRTIHFSDRELACELLGLKCD